MRIDAHQHFWKISRNDYGWITPTNPVLYRDYLPSDLEPHVHKNGISKTILVQAAPTVEETEYMLELSETADIIAGVVGWLDLADPSYKKQYERFCRHPKFIGLRVMIQEMGDLNTVFASAYIEALSYLAEQEFPFDLLVMENQLPQRQPMMKSLKY